MITNYFNVICALVPTKVDSILVVDPDAIFTVAVALQLFQSVAGWTTKVIQFVCACQDFQLSSCRGFNVFELPNAIPIKKSSGVFTAK
jgi:hypothetical protein